MANSDKTGRGTGVSPHHIYSTSGDTLVPTVPAADPAAVAAHRDSACRAVGAGEASPQEAIGEKSSGVVLDLTSPAKNPPKKDREAAALRSAEVISFAAEVSAARIRARAALVHAEEILSRPPSWPSEEDEVAFLMRRLSRA